MAQMGRCEGNVTRWLFGALKGEWKATGLLQNWDSLACLLVHLMNRASMQFKLCYCVVSKQRLGMSNLLCSLLYMIICVLIRYVHLQHQKLSCFSCLIQQIIGLNEVISSFFWNFLMISYLCSTCIHAKVFEAGYSYLQNSSHTSMD